MVARLRRRTTQLALLAVVLGAAAPHVPDAARGSIVIVTGQQATLPIPTLMEGPAASTANIEMADQLFLRLAGLPSSLRTAGDEGFVPLLARSWSRRDSLTLVFELDPRARWHDGVPVTARDVVFTFQRARDSTHSPRTARLLRYVDEVRAEDTHRVSVRFTRAYAEQLYDATYHVAPIPAHLLESMTPPEIARSEYAQRPIGSGPYRWVRSRPGEFVELAAVPDFFLGRPQLERVIVRTATDPEARMNLILSGQADAMEQIPPPLSNVARLRAARDFRLLPVPSPTVGYLLFNHRDRADRSRPHPILGDLRVRRAIGLALDRQTMVRAAFGEYAEVPFGPASSLLWIRHRAPRASGPKPDEARRLLAEAGWRDTDGDGILDRDGQRLELLLNYPATSAVREQLALQAQEQLRKFGVAISLQRLDAPVWLERRNRGDFDIDFSSATQDPTPSGLTQSWSCAGGSNVGRYCNAAVDSLMERAILGHGDPEKLWAEVLTRIEADAPAVFMYAPLNTVVVHRRYRNVTLRPESAWLRLHEWAVAPGRQLPRDRQPGI